MNATERRLRQAPERSLSALLRRTLITPESQADSLENLPDELAGVLNDALAVAGVSLRDLSASYAARARMRDVLAGAVQARILGSAAARLVRQRMAIEGKLPLSHYRVVAANHRGWKEAGANTLVDARAVLENPIASDHIVSRPDARGTRKGLRIALGASQDETKLLVVVALYTAESIQIFTCVQMLKSDLVRTRIASATAALRAFLDIYGVPLQVGASAKSVLFLDEVVPVQERPDGSGDLLQMWGDEGARVEVLFGHRRTELASIDVHYAYAINYSAYFADRRLFPTGAELRRVKNRGRS